MTAEILTTTLTNLTSVFTGLMANVTAVVDVLTSSPILFIGFGVSLTYAVIRMAKRLLNI